IAVGAIGTIEAERQPDDHPATEAVVMTMVVAMPIVAAGGEPGSAERRSGMKARAGKAARGKAARGETARGEAPRESTAAEGPDATAVALGHCRVEGGHQQRQGPGRHDQSTLEHGETSRFLGAIQACRSD